MGTCEGRYAYCVCWCTAQNVALNGLYTPQEYQWVPVRVDAYCVWWFSAQNVAHNGLYTPQEYQWVPVRVDMLIVYGDLVPKTLHMYM